MPAVRGPRILQACPHPPVGPFFSQAGGPDAVPLSVLDHQSKNVMVVDDDPAIRELLVSALRARGYDYSQAAGGMHAAELLGCAKRLPDLLICDVTMPGLDGFSFVRFMRTNGKLSGVPIIFLTARSGVSDVLQGMSLGARQYVQKPFRVRELMELIDRLLV